VSVGAALAASNDVAPALLEVSELKQHFPVHGGVFGRITGLVKAVDGVSFSVARGETLALVGESGCGKTTVGRALLRLITPTSGQVRFDGQDVLSLNAGALRALRRRMQIIFQDPYASLNPRISVGDAIAEPISVHGLLRGRDVERRVGELLERVGLPAAYRTRFPHEFSGGQRQRIGIARALAVGPEFIVCDEAISALDISIQAQILNLLADLQAELGLAYLFITHNLNVVRHIAHRVAVMYLGKLVEVAPASALFENPRHPYTQALLAANPVPDPSVPLDPAPLEGEVPSPLDPPSGCRFHTRCPKVFEPCPRVVPVETLLGGGATRAHRVYCHLYRDAS
jgi:oligopeptide/dipeptide ABC transporter ATP-binding protein